MRRMDQLSPNEIQGLRRGEELRVGLNGSLTGGLFIGLKPGAPGIIIVRLATGGQLPKRVELEIGSCRIERVHPPLAL